MILIGLIIRWPRRYDEFGILRCGFESGRAVDLLHLEFMRLQVLANFLSTPLASGLDGDAMGWPYVAFDLNPGVVKV